MKKSEFKNPVFVVALVLCAAMALLAIVFNEGFAAVSDGLFTFLTASGFVRLG